LDLPGERQGQQSLYGYTYAEKESGMASGAA